MRVEVHHHQRDFRHPLDSHDRTRHTSAIMQTVTAADQRRWEGIVRDWDVGSSTVLTQINEQLREQYPAEWTEPYQDFVYGFRGLFPAQDVLGVCGQWVACRQRDMFCLYAAVPGTAGGVYTPGDPFDISQLFPKEKLQEPSGFAELWEAVQDGHGRLCRLMDSC